MNATRIELQDVQGLAFYGYARHPLATYLHVSFGPRDRTARWLEALLPRVRRTLSEDGRSAGIPPEEETEKGPPVHVAFTATGLSALGLTADQLAPFPREFVTGMNDRDRSRVLGDPLEGWEFGGAGQPPIHAVLLLYAANTAAMTKRVAEWRALVTAAGGDVLHEDTAHYLDGKREHFGFRDGISEPHVRGGPRRRRTQEPSLPAGELLLGYADAYGQMAPPIPLGNVDLGHNGTFLVYRKLRQDVRAFWSTARELARPAPGESARDAAVRLASSFVGRWPGGTPLVRGTETAPVREPPDNTFMYRDLDPDGHRCPFGAHTRRANPRDMLPPDASDSLQLTSRHRLFRRGRSYGKPPAGFVPGELPLDDGVERGLVFIALGASLRRQFEFVHNTWINNPQFNGLVGERDPVIGSRRLDDDGAGHLTVQATPARRRISGLPPFVDLRGGAYFFLPGLRALHALQALAARG